MIEWLPSAAEVVRVGAFSVRWYGLFYVVAFGVVYFYGRRLLRWRSVEVSDDDWLLIITVGVAGVLVGGRLGYVLLYEPGYYWRHLGEVFRLWDGGMSWHGGVIGVGLGLWWVVRRLGISWLALLDCLVGLVALGLALGRVGNWLNGELFSGNMALVASGCLVVVGVSCLLFLRNSARVGLPTAVFLIGYALQRLVLEVWRIDGWSSWGILTRGQWFTLPVLILGIWLVGNLLNQRYNKARNILR